MECRLSVRMKSFVVAIPVVLLGFVTVCKTDLDLYLDAHETYRLLGKSLFWENSVLVPLGRIR